ncbi:MAG TPA: hypothetical protein VEH27_03280 [Methylomirabilota bacterium]|nr:hypothetical protein [Methylomirabilota bacterium]
MLGSLTNPFAAAFPRRVGLFLLLLAPLCWTTELRAQPNSPDGLVYKSGYSSIMKLGRDLYTGLKKDKRDTISAQPISIETDLMPFVKLLYYPDDPNPPIRGVWISAGFIDLVNHVAHAKAIDRKQKGFFDKYVMSLAQETGEMELKPLPGDTNPAYWTDDMLNEQLSNFNSIVGMVVGIKLAHHYLGHYEKYKDRLQDKDGKTIPINSLLSEEEWREALLKGARNALDAGCTIEGVIPFFEAFEKMETRPAWAPYFLPNTAKFSRLKKDLEKVQKDFFAGRD